MNITDRINWKLTQLERFRNSLDIWDWRRRMDIMRKARKELHRNKNQVRRDRVVADAMFYLNQMAKAHVHQRITYALKNHLMRVLYESGYCVKVELSEQKLECWHTAAYLNGHDDYCPKCANTGVFRRHVLYSFTFSVDGLVYNWHQPESLVDWAVTVGGEVGEYDGRRPQNLTMDHDRINFCHALVYCWLVERGVSKDKLPSFQGFWKSLRQDVVDLWWNSTLWKAWMRIKYRRHEEDPDWIPF